MRARSTSAALALLAVTTGAASAAQGPPLESLPRMFPPEQGIGIGAAADFNGDGSVDLVLDRSEGVSIYLGDDGLFDGPRILLPGTTAAVALDVVDFDGDGRPDVVVDVESFIRIFTNDGTGSFTEAHTLVATGDAFAMAAVDVDLDGDIDVLEGHYGATPTLYRNQGGGLFDVENPLPIGGDINLFEVADFDGDGSPDIMMASTGSCDPFGCFLGNVFLYTNDGTGQFSAAPFASPPTYVNEAAVGDLDGDGYLDVVLAASSVDGGSFVLAGNGAGGLQSLVDHFGTELDGRRVALTDLSFDGDLDVYFESLDGNRLFEHQATAFDYVDVSNRLPGSCCAGRSFGGDLDGDGFGDFFFSAGPSLLLSDADGLLQDAAGTDPSTAASVNELALANIDGDALPDAFVRTSSSIDVLLGNGEGGFAWSASIAPGGYAPGTRLLLPADIDGDGDSDLLSLWQTQLDDLLRNDEGAFADVSLTQLPSQPSNSLGGVFLDVEGDGDDDVVVVGTAFQSTRLLVNDGGGTFALAPSSQLPFGPNADGVAALDAELDGDLDLIFSGGQLLFNDGTGAYPFPIATVGASGSPATGDFDGDGYPDILMGSKVLWNDGGTFSSAGSVTLAGSGGMLVADIEGDGDLDVLSGSGMLFENVDGAFRPEELTEEDLNNRAPSVADFDGDQDVDVVFPGGVLLNGVAQHTAWRRLARTGRELQIDVYGDAGEPFALLWALGTSELSLPGFGTLLLDPSTLSVAVVGTSDPDGYASFAATVPDVASLAGIAVHWQSLVGALPRFTNREATVIGAGVRSRTTSSGLQSAAGSSQ